jgi:hypothetical protein
MGGRRAVTAAGYPRLERLVRRRVVRGKPLAQDTHQSERRLRPLAQDRFERRPVNPKDTDVGNRAVGLANQPGSNVVLALER